jgi:Flp pilus assembly pilin Flp
MHRSWHAAWLGLFRRLHRDERGAVSLETILIIGAIAIPALIFMVRFGWPRIKGLFVQGLDELQSERQGMIQ